MSEIKQPTLAEMTDYLVHYGTKGMKWGVRRNSDGGGTLKVKARPTYTTQEKRSAYLDAKQAKKDGRRTPLDKEGFSQERLAKLPTVQRRLVNGILGTKWTAASVAGMATGLALAAATTTATGGLSAVGVAGVALFGGSYTGGQVAGIHAAYKAFFQNMVHNPKIRAKVKLSPNEMAKYATGQNFVKSMRTDRGKITVSSMKGKTTIDIFDKEGRKVGTQTQIAPKLPTKPAPGNK